MWRASWVCVVTLVVLLGAGTGAAAPEEESREAERTALYEQGVKLAQAERWREAVEKFRKVVDIRSAPRARFTLGEAEEKCGLFASAKKSYSLALAQAQATGDKEAAGAAGAALASIERKVPRVIVKLAEPLDGLRATVDGRETQLVQEGLELDPGEHLLVIEAPGRQPFERHLTASEGRTIELAVDLAPGEASSSRRLGGDRDVPGASDAGGTPAGAWVLGATGVAAAAVGIGLYVAGSGAYDDAADRCSASGCSDVADTDDGNAARSQMIAGDVLMVVGGGAVLGAVIWLVVSATEAAGDETGTSARWHVRGSATQGGFMLGLGGAL